MAWARRDVKLPIDSVFDALKSTVPLPSVVMAGHRAGHPSKEPATMRKGYVYLLASKPYGTLYIGVTNNLAERVHAHRIGIASHFTRKYRVTRLVWWEEHSLVAEAIQRETSMKKWKRDWKIDLVNARNPMWLDLFEVGDMPSN